MERLLDFLDNLFSPLTNILGQGLEFFHGSAGLPWWLSIVILTVIIRSLLFPLTVKQVKSMRAMQELQPELTKIRDKYKDDPQRMKEEQFKLYQDSGVNPLGGCFPLLIQMPIFIGMFYVIRGFEETDESFTEGGFWWFQDLSAMDPFYILPVVSAVTMLAASEITSKNVQPQQRWMMRILPVVFTIFLLTFPAGLFMYWITSNLVTLVQNYLIYNHGPGKKPAAEVEKRETPRDTRSSAPDPEPVSPNGADKSETQRTKAAKRKRRKKKK